MSGKSRAFSGEVLMRFFGLLLLGACLCACGNADERGRVAREGGRYHGIGTYPPGQMWQRMVSARAPREHAAATLADDEQVIVVVDSETGEVRQCGNLSGHCIAMNPWAAQQAEPVRLTEHANEIDVLENAANVAEPGVNGR